MTIKLKKIKFKPKQKLLEIGNLVHRGETIEDFEKNIGFNKKISGRSLSPSNGSLNPL